LDQVTRPAQAKFSRAVNLFGVVAAQDPFWQGNLAEIRRLLERIGLEVILSGDGDTVETIRRAAGAGLSILLSGGAHVSAVKHFRERFDVPYLRHALPIGTETAAFLRQVANATGIDRNAVEAVIADEEQVFWKYMTKLSEAYAFILVNREFGVVADSSYAVSITRFLTADLGLTPKIVVVTDEPADDERETVRREILDLPNGLAPTVVFEPDGYRIGEALRANRPDILIGSSADKDIARSLHVPILTVSYPLVDRLALSNGYTGYRGAVNLAEDLGTAILSAM
jgi:nitrogenase molybdenum-iron protein beta chain